MIELKLPQQDSGELSQRNSGELP